MNKYKLIKRKGLRKLLVKGIKGQELSEWQVNAINGEGVAGLLPLEVRKSGSTYQLEYEITGYLTLQDYLQRPLTKGAFAALLQNILKTQKAAQEKKLNPQMLLYDMDKVFVNAPTGSLFFIYVPLQPFEGDNTLQVMLRKIIRCCSFEEEEATEYVGEYVSILNRGVTLSFFALEEYAGRLMKSARGEDVPQTVECPRCHSVVPAETVKCKCGCKLRGITGETNGSKNLIYDPFGGMQEPEQPFVSPEEPDPALVNKGRGRTGTTVLPTYEQEPVPQAQLVRRSTDESISLTKLPFRLGRESGDYVVDNRYVSEPHMDILYRDGAFYALDLDSTNRTYLDGIPLEPRQEMQLISPCQLKLANEVFDFYIE